MNHYITIENSLVRWFQSGNGIFKYPIFLVGSVAMFVVWFLSETEQEASEFFDGISLKEKYWFRFDRKWVWGIAAIIGSRVFVLSSKVSVFVSGKYKVLTVLGLISVVFL